MFHGHVQQRSLTSCNFLWFPPSSIAPTALTPNRAAWQNMATKLDLLSPLSHIFFPLFLPISTPF